MSILVDERVQDLGPEARTHSCFLSEEDRQLLKEVLKIANTVKGNAIKGFAFGIFLVFLLGTVGAVFGIKILFDLIRGI